MENLVSGTSVTLLGALFGTAWTFFKSQDWYQRAKERRYAQALLALEAGVDQTYQTYVRSIKESSADGKLTPAERRRARELARDAAVLYGRTQGIDVINEVGQEYIDLWINRLVSKLKKES
ncbi:MAG: hypothetical protein IT365_27965 [Candidatus Hydrogenedentes bacterium]|nr:hypothetical protein [Candidatus Hydrogenedentota bacterium]